MNLSDTTEDSLINSITEHLKQRSDVLVGPGDDCAIVELPSGDLQLLKTDCVVENVHFLAEESAERVGWKAIARVVSDIAAMGGTPQAFVVTLVLRPDTSLAWIQDLYKGMQACADSFQLSIVGGETSSSPAGSSNVISVAGTGHVDKVNIVLRSTSNPDDIIFVTGCLGGSIAGKHLDFTPRLAEAQFLVNHCQPSAMMDLSDGLAKDLPRMARLSDVGYKIDPVRIPCSPGSSTQQALSDGEDYELLFTVPPSVSAELIKLWPDHLTPITAIGEMTSLSDSMEALDGGWDHFS